MPDTRPTVSVQPAALLPGDVLLRDPDAPEREIEWRNDRVGYCGDVRVAEYRTEDGTEGTHGFEDPTVWLTVAVRDEGSAA